VKGRCSASSEQYLLHYGSIFSLHGVMISDLRWNGALSVALAAPS
jgi:hypothetical protein